jgi:DNA-binding response OmpR family regulator
MLTAQVEESRDPGAVRVLVVDDDEDTCRSTAMAIQLKGHEARTAFTGEEAITAAPGFAPDLVLLDLSMPDMDGLQLARALRQTTSLQEPVIAAVSGYASLAHKRLCANAGFDHYLTKPVDFAALEHLIRLANERVALQEDFANLKRQQAESFYTFCRSQLEFGGLVLDSVSVAPTEHALAKVQRLHEKIAAWVRKTPGFTEDQAATLRILLGGLQVRLTTILSRRQRQ